MPAQFKQIHLSLKYMSKQYLYTSVIMAQLLTTSPSR